MFFEDIIQSSDAVPLFAITLAFCLGLVWTIGVLCIGFVKALRGGSSKATAQVADDTRSFQELQRGFRRMEERVESLETLLIDRSRRESVRREFD